VQSDLDHFASSRGNAQFGRARQWFELFPVARARGEKKSTTQRLLSVIGRTRIESNETRGCVVGIGHRPGDVTRNYPASSAAAASAAAAAEDSLQLASNARAGRTHC